MRDRVGPDAPSAASTSTMLLDFMRRRGALHTRPGERMRASVIALACGLLPVVALPAAEFHLVYVGPESGSALRGSQLGIDESNRQGAFLDVRLSLAVWSDGPVPGNAIAILADRRGGIVDVAGAAGGRAVLNLTDETDALRSACLENVLHIIPSARMKADAVTQWTARNPGDSVSASGWHGSAVKFAARDLNKRFRQRFGMAMDAQAWAGWFAVRAVSETLIRDPDADAASLLRSLREADGLDGQKGDPLSFRNSGQLRQPLVLVNETEELVGEAPVRGAADGLDSLGASPCE